MNIFVAATGQHVGKTTTTLGLTAAFQNQGLDVGYCKPVGQKSLDVKTFRVDKDAVLFSDLLGLELDPDVHSPVILGKGATAKYLDNPDQIDLSGMIAIAAETLASRHELTIYEGTGHPGVGSVADVSNADVAKTIGAGVIMVVEGGIGNCIDRLNMSLALFREQNVPILGVIINKIREDKMDKIVNYVGKKLERMQLPILGAVPYDQVLAYPVARTIAHALNGTVSHNDHRLDNIVVDILPGSLMDVEELGDLTNLLLIVSPRQIERAINRIDSLVRIFNIKDFPLSAIVCTGNDKLSDSTQQYIETHEIPVIRTHLDTYGSYLKIKRIEVKINRSTPWKVARAIQLIEENVDMEIIEERCKVLGV